MLFKSKEVIVSEQSFVVKDRNQCLKVEGWGRDTVRVTCYPNHKGFDNNPGGILSEAKSSPTYCRH